MEVRLDNAVVTFAVRDEALGIPPLNAVLGDGNARVIDGYGGWQITERPRQIGLTTWNGFQPIQMEIPIILDAFFGDAPPRRFNLQNEVNSDTHLEDTYPKDTIDKDVALLERMAGRGPGGGSSQPPQITISAYRNLVPHTNPASGVKAWVIEGIDWQEAIYNRNGRRVRQTATVTVLQSMTDKAFRNLSAAQRKREDRAARSGLPTRHTVKKGDTLSKLAVKYYRDADLWYVIARANKIRDPRKLKIGSKLKIPKKPK